MSSEKLTRRSFLRMLAISGAGAVLAACGGTPAGKPTAAPAAEPTAAPAAQPTAAPAAEPTAAPAEPTAAPAAEPTAAPAAEKAGEFHGAFPYQVPPTGHWNS